MTDVAIGAPARSSCDDAPKWRRRVLPVPRQLLIVPGRTAAEVDVALRPRHVGIWVRAGGVLGASHDAVPTESQAIGVGRGDATVVTAAVHRTRRGASAHVRGKVVSEDRATIVRVSPRACGGLTAAAVTRCRHEPNPSYDHPHEAHPRIVALPPAGGAPS